MSDLSKINLAFSTRRAAAGVKPTRPDEYVAELSVLPWRGFLGVLQERIVMFTGWPFWSVKRNGKKITVSKWLPE